MTAGPVSYTATLSSAEPDADPADNSLTAEITVNSTSGGADGGNGSDDDESGGGAAGPVTLWLFGLMTLLVRRRSGIAISG